MLWMWTSLALAQDARCPTIEAEPNAVHAETLHRWAVASGDDLELHCHALALSRGEAAGAATMRIDNSFDTVRNVYPATWWLLGEDTVAEPSDGPGDLPDFTVRALENAWTPMGRALDAPTRSVVGASVSCRGDVELCPGLTDSLEGMVERHPRLHLAESGDLALTIDVMDHVVSPREALRVAVTASERGQSQRTQGVGADHVPWRQLDLVWVLGLALAAAAGAIAGQRTRHERRSIPASLARVAGGLVVGVLLGWFAMDWMPMAPPLDEAALTPHGLPALAPLMWAVGLGVTLLLLPVLACVVGVLILGRSLGLEALDRFDLGLLAPGAVAGALGMALAPLPVGMGPTGLLTCAAVGLPGVFLASAAGGVIEDTVHAGIGRGTPRRLMLPLGLAVAAALATMPAALSGELPWAVLVLGCLAAVGVGFLGRARHAESTESADLGAVVGGSLRTPRYVATADRDPAPLVATLRTAGFHQVVIEGPDGVGKSRFARELVRRLDLDGLRVGVGEAEAAASEGRTAPYAVVSAALGQVLGEQIELAAVQAREAAFSEAAGAASEAALEVLPGVGVLLSLSEQRDSQELTVERIRRDVTRALRDAVDAGPVALVVDDIQWADPSSLGLLAHVAQVFAEPDEPLRHPLVLVLVQRPGDGDHSALSEPGDRLVLAPLEPDQVADLLAAAGVQAHEGFAESVADRVGGRPRHVLELVQELVAAELVETRADDAGLAVLVPQDLDDIALARAVPRHLRELEEMRLARIEDPRRRLLLQAAANCGRTFPTHALAAGLGWSRIEVLAELAEVERTVGLIDDLDDDERFRFRTELTRQVLAASSERAEGGPRKVMREFHFRVVDHLCQLDPQPLGEIVMHALRSGDRGRASAGEHAVMAAAVAERRGAVPEAVHNIEIARRLQTALPGASAEQLDLVEARVLRRGEVAEQRRAIDLFRGLVDSLHVDRLQVVNGWFSTAFGLRQKSDLAALVAEIQAVRQRLDDASQHSLVEAVCDFYESLARAEQRGLRAGPDGALAGELQVQIDRLRPLEPSRSRDLLLARILQAQAPRLEDQEAYLRVSQESLELKERHGDLAGQALTMGMLANYWLWWAPEPDAAEARRWLERDLEQVDKLGDMAARSSILNRIALSHWMEGQRDAALETATLALRRARQSASAVDVLFAGWAVLKYASELGSLADVERVGNKLVQPPEHWPWATAEELFGDVPAGVLAARADELDDLGEALDAVGASDGWRTRLAALLR